MKIVTSCKPFEEVQDLLKNLAKIYLIGCGGCATELKTGGKKEVLAMKARLEETGKAVTGWMIIPNVCDELTVYAVKKEAKKIQLADAILVLACGFGVQRVSGNTAIPAIPGLDTLFIGYNNELGVVSEICRQCGQCLLGETAGICPITACRKGLLNGPCGGTNKGKCEIDKEKDCAWTLIYKRLKEQGRFDVLEKIHEPKKYNITKNPGRVRVNR